MGVRSLLTCDYLEGITEDELLDVVELSNEQKLRYEICATCDGRALRASGKRSIAIGKSENSPKRDDPEVDTAQGHGRLTNGHRVSLESSTKPSKPSKSKKAASGAWQ